MNNLDPYRSGMSNDLPPELWIGKIDNQWPLRVFADPEQARRWMAEPEGTWQKRLWHVVDVTGTELNLTAPIEPQLIPSDDE